MALSVNKILMKCAVFLIENFRTKYMHLKLFLSLAMLTLKVVPTPIEEEISEEKIRDIKDRPILRAALYANADVLLTGDKDFLESGLKHPKIMTAAEFIQMN